MAAGTVGAREFLEHWGTLNDAGKPSEDRAVSYLSFAGYLKDNAGTPEFYACMGQFRQRLTKIILNDVKSGSCDQEALQVFGYCLHNSNFAKLFSEEEASVTIRALCDVVGGESVSRNVCTRALWCLANQSFPMDILTAIVPKIVSTATEVVVSQKFETSVVAAEALNTFISLHQRCLEAFTSCAPTWYKAVFTLIFCKVPKLQRKALNLACVFERHLLGSHELVHWLIKELREHAASTMAQLMTEKGQDHCVILNAWGHFITLLGKTLHKHGSFLNELLKVVEVGFKHKGFVLQVAAYKAWKALVTNFSLDVGLMSSPKRLKLLLMPLLASAVKDRHEQVENMRMQVWWHLISCLGSKIQDLFQQVCVPFLLFSLGVDPKLDLSQLPTFVSNLNTSRPYSTPQTLESDHSSTDNKSVSSPSMDKENCLTLSPERTQDPLQDGLGTPGMERRRCGFLLSLALSARSQSSQSSSKKRSGDRYQTTPSLEMVLSGCQAALQFVGVKDELPGSMIKTDFLSMAYLNCSVSQDIARFLLLFLDGVIMYAGHYGSQFKDDVLALVVQRVVNVILISAEHISEKDGRSLLSALLELSHSSVLQEILSPVAKLELLCVFVSISPHLLLSPGNTPGQALWQSLLDDFLKINRTEFNRDTFHNCWVKLVSAATSLPPCLQSFQYLMEQVDGIASGSEGATRTVLVKMWTTVAKKFAGYVKKTSDINHGSVISPDFTSSRLILKFPFQYLLTGTGERNTINSCLGTWKDVYDVVNIHMSLAVKDPNLCTQLVCGDLYSVYGQNAKVDSVCLERTRLTHFDIYQNSVAVALQFIASKVNWGSLASQPQGRGEGRAKSIQSLLNLLAWQLATFWDTVQKSFFPLATLTTPYTISDTLSQLYGSFPTAPIIQAATEMLAQPLATLWETLLSSEPLPSVSRPRSKQPKDLHLQVIAVWKSIMTCFQARYTSPFDSTVLSSLSPLLVVALGSGRNELLGPTLSFWATTFDQAGQLTYPEKLREAFSQFLKTSKSSVGHQLRLPGFNREVLSIEDSFGNNSEAVSQSTEPHPQDNDPSVVLPNPSPRKGVKGSFLNQLQSPIRQAPPTTPERSPAAKSLDDILARSRTKQPASAGSGADDGRGGRKSGSGPSAALSVRRKLSLTGEEEETYVAVAPPTKKRRLLTEHQKERLRERSPIPVLYNALDPSQDSSLPFTMDDEPVPESPPGNDPIIIPESEVSPATPISLRRSGPQTTPSSGARRSLPAEAMDTDAQSEFPVPFGDSKSRSDNSNSHSSTRTPKPLGEIPIPIPKPGPSNDSHAMQGSTSGAGANPGGSTSTSSRILSPAEQNRQLRDVIVVQDDVDDVDETPPLAPPTSEAPPTVTPTPLEPVPTSSERQLPSRKKDAAFSDKTPPIATTLPVTRNPPRLIPHPHTPNQAPAPSHTSVPPKLFSTSRQPPRNPPYRHLSHSSTSSEDGRGHSRPALLDAAVRTTWTTSVAGRQVASAPLLPPASKEVPAKTATASVSDFRYGLSQPPPPYTATPLTIAPPHSRPPPHTSALLPLHHPTQPPRASSTLVTVPPSHRHTHSPHMSTSITAPHSHQYAPTPLTGHPRIGTLPRTPLSPPHSQPRPQLPPPLSHPPILPSPSPTTDIIPQRVYQTLVQQPAPLLPTPISPARHPLSSPPPSLAHPLPHAHHPPAVPRGLSPTETAFGIRHSSNSGIFEKAIQLVHTMNPPNQLPASQQVLEYSQTAMPRQASSRMSTRSTPIALMAVDSETNGGMYVVMRHDIVDNVSPTSGTIMPGGQPGIPIPVPNSSISMRQPMAVTSTVRDAMPMSVMTRQQHAAISRPRSSVSIPRTASQAPLSPNRNPFLNSRQVASTAEAVKRHFATREMSGIRARQRGGHRLIAPDTNSSSSKERRPQALPSRPVEPVTVVDLTQQGDTEYSLDLTSERLVVARRSEALHARVPPPSETTKTPEQLPASRVVAESDIQAPSASGNRASELVEDPLVGLSSGKPVRGGGFGEEEGLVDHGVADVDDAMEVGESSSKLVPDSVSVSDSGVPAVADDAPMDSAPLPTGNGKQREGEGEGQLRTGSERNSTQQALSASSSSEGAPDSELADGREGAKLVSSSVGDGAAATADGGRNSEEGEERETPPSLPLPQLPPLPKAPLLSGTQEVPDTSEKTSTASGDGSKRLDEGVPQTPKVAVKPAPPATPTQQVQGGADPSPKATPGILKHTSQFDTPSSANKGRRVQFASAPVVIQSSAGKSNTGTEEEAFKTPRHSRGPRTPQSLFSSRRTLLMPQTPTRMIQVSKAGSTPSPASGAVVYPALADCSSPVEQIVPVLSPSSRYTHGLLQLVHARNIHTVGNISSLTEQQVQTLPIQSPKVETLKNALRSFQQQQLGSKRRNSADSDAGLSKVSRISQAASSSSEEKKPPETGVEAAKSGLPPDRQEEESQLTSERQEESQLTQSSEEQGDVITLSTPDSQLRSEEVQGAGQGEAATPTQVAEKSPSSMSSEPQLKESHSEAGLEPESVKTVPTAEDLMETDKPNEEVALGDDEVFEESSKAVTAEASAHDAGKDTEMGDSAQDAGTITEMGDEDTSAQDVGKDTEMGDGDASKDAEKDAEMREEDAGKDAEMGDGDLSPPVGAEVADVVGEKTEGESAAMDVELAEQPQEPPEAEQPQEPPEAEQPQEPPEAEQPQEPPEAEQPQEPPEEGSGQERPTSTVIHDHSYCSQNHSDSVPVSGKEDRELGPDPAPHSSKLSSTSTDHTYCYSNSSQDVSPEPSSSSTVTTAAGEEPLQACTEEPTPDCNSAVDKDEEEDEVLPNAESQELFSYDHGDHGITSPTLDLPSPGTAPSLQSEDPDSDEATREYQTPPPDDMDAIAADFATDYPDSHPSSVAELASYLDFVTTSLPNVADVAGVLEHASLEEAYSLHQQLGAIAFHCMRLQQLGVGRGVEE